MKKALNPEDLDVILDFNKEQYKVINGNKTDVKTISVVKNKYLNYNKLYKYIVGISTYDNNFIENLKYKIKTEEKNNAAVTSREDATALLDFIKSDEAFVRSLHFMNCFKIHQYGESNNAAEVEILNKINNFIETGIL